MSKPSQDHRTPERKAADEHIAGESPLSAPSLAADAITAPMESHRVPRRRHVAVAGVVENGLVRPLDPDIKLPEHARVIIVASQ